MLSERKGKEEEAWNDEGKGMEEMFSDKGKGKEETLSTKRRVYGLQCREEGREEVTFTKREG